MILYARRRPLVAISQCKESVILLSFLWILGLVFGLYFVASMDNSLLETFYIASINRPSIFSILFVSLLPIAVSATAVFCSGPVLIYALCILKAFCFSVSLCGVISVFGYSGWLLRLLLLFSDSCMVVLLLWLWCRILLSKHNSVLRDLLICTAIAVAVSMVDYFLVSPYLGILMHYL